MTTATCEPASRGCTHRSIGRVLPRVVFRLESTHRSLPSFIDRTPLLALALDLLLFSYRVGEPPPRSPSFVSNRHPHPGYAMLGTLYQCHPHHLRSPLHSRHRPPTHRPCEQTTSPSLELDAPTSRFPISSIRPEAPQNCSPDPPIDPPKLVYPRYDPLYVLSCPSTPTPHLPSLPSYAHVSPNPAPSVAPGVLADGVLTAMLPDVKDFLAEAAIAPPACPQFPTDERVLALAALSVFYKPLHPAHWVFWNREQKKATAAIVQSVLGQYSSHLSVHPSPRLSFVCIVLTILSAPYRYNPFSHHIPNRLDRHTREPLDPREHAARLCVQTCHLALVCSVHVHGARA